MKFVIQRVKQASVKVEGSVIGEIEKGYLVLIGVSDKDTEAVADKMIKKMIGLRIFEDAEGKTNLSLADVGGSLLLVSEFTVCAPWRGGPRARVCAAGAPDKANQLYEYIIEESKKSVSVVQTGRFGAEMEVSLINDGPFTILLDSEML